MKFADPKNDFAFKKIFGDKNHKNILISFLNSILDFKNQHEIVDLELTNPYQVPEIEEFKETILDIKAKNKAGDEFLVEMQKKLVDNFAKRSQFYAAKAYASQLKKSQPYENLKKVFFIGILDFRYFAGKDYISRHLILNEKTLKNDLSDFEFTFIELPKFNKSCENLATTLDKWLYFIKNAPNLEMIPALYQNKQEFADAFDIASQKTWSKKELDIYEYRLKVQRDDIGAIDAALKEGMKKGIEKGIEKGKIEGVKEGMEKGIEKGMEKEKIATAKKMLKAGIDKTTIAQITGLSLDAISKL